jgi:predicted nucleic acid-binding protein
MRAGPRPRMLDTNVFNKLLDGEISSAALTGPLLITGVQRAELKATSNTDRRTALLKIAEDVNPAVMPAASFCWDIAGAGWDEAHWNDGSGQFEDMLDRLKVLDWKAGKKVRDPRNQMRDIVIAGTAIKLGAILVTNDRNLQTVVSEFGGCYTEMMVEWLQRFHTELAERLHNAEPVLDMIPD